MAFTGDVARSPTVRLEILEIVPTRTRYSGPPRLQSSRLITPVGDIDWVVHPRLVDAAAARLLGGPRTAD